tara:strand:+ start:5705 stop:6586 length:882 start_codon:yes stop_codon:yes gene_type:complete
MEIDMTQVTGIHRLTLAVPELEPVGVYYREVVGLRVLAEGEARWDLQCRASRHCDFSLVARQGAPAISSIALSVGSQKELPNLISAAVNAGGEVLREPAPSSDYPGEFSAAVVDPDGNHIELIYLEPTSNECADDVLTSGPQRIGHVVLWTPQIELMETFFGQLGLHVTDRTAMGMSFLRCNTDHHSVAVVRSKGQTGLQHVAFDVGSIDDVMREKGRVSSVGVECVWGVGRHGPGNNVFSYYQDPAGNIFEFYGDMEKFTDNEEVGEPVFWGPEHRGDLWGVAGPAPQSFRP